MDAYIQGLKSKLGSHWSVSSSRKNLGARKERFCDLFQGHSKTLENETLVNIDTRVDDRVHSRKLKNGLEFSNATGSSSSIDLEWETAEGNRRFIEIVKTDNNQCILIFVIYSLLN